MNLLRRLWRWVWRKRSAPELVDDCPHEAESRAFRDTLLNGGYRRFQCSCCGMAFGISWMRSDLPYRLTPRFQHLMRHVSDELANIRAEGAGTR